MAGLVHKKEPEGSYQEGCRWRLHHYTGCLTASGLKCPFQLSWKCQLWASISSRQYSSDTASVIPLSDLQRGEKNLLYYQGKSHTHTLSPGAECTHTSQGVVSLKHSENVWTGGHPSIMVVVDIVIVIKTARQVYNTALLFCLVSRATQHCELRKVSVDVI